MSIEAWGWHLVALALIGFLFQWVLRLLDAQAERIRRLECKLRLIELKGERK